MAKLRAAVVGVGYLGNFHAQKFKALSEKSELNAELVAVCDLSAPQAHKVAEALQVAAFSKPQDLIGKVDAVTIATTTLAHFELTRFFLENKVHVNVEKPICVASSEAQILVDLAKANNLVLCVGHSERFNPAFRELQAQTKNPTWIEFNRYAPFKARGSEVSVLHDLMIHDLDLMFEMDSSACRLVSAQAGKLVTATEDWCSASFEFESGLRTQINSSRLAKEMTRSVRAIDNKNIWLANLQNGELEQTKFSGNSEAPVSLQVHNTGRGDNLLTENDAFLRAIQGLSNQAVRGEAGLKALQWVEKILGFVHTRRGA